MIPKNGLVLHKKNAAVSAATLPTSFEEGAILWPNIGYSTDIAHQ